MVTIGHVFEGLYRARQFGHVYKLDTVILADWIIGADRMSLKQIDVMMARVVSMIVNGKRIVSLVGKDDYISAEIKGRMNRGSKFWQMTDDGIAMFNDIADQNFGISPDKAMAIRAQEALENVAKHGFIADRHSVRAAIAG